MVYMLWVSTKDKAAQFGIQRKVCNKNKNENKTTTKDKK